MYGGSLSGPPEAVPDEGGVSRQGTDGLRNGLTHPPEGSTLRPAQAATVTITQLRNGNEKMGFGSASLGNYGNNSATPGQTGYFEPGFCENPGVPGASRRMALALRERLWSVSSLSDVRKCGKVPRASLLPLVEAPGGIRLTGLCTCHSVWVCPICAPEIRAARGAEIAEALSSRLSDGGFVSFGTGTLSHSGGHSLRSTYSLVVDAWAAVCRDGSVKRFRKAHGYWGFIRTTEVTHSFRNGWHPHMHWLDFWEEPQSWEDLKEYQGLVWGAWSRAVTRLGVGRRASPERGVLVLPVRLGEVEELSKYVVEMDVPSAAFELTAVSTKKARSDGGLAPFELLAKVYGPGSKPWVDLWWEYEQSTRGRRMLGSSRGLLKRLGVGEDDPEPCEDGEVVAYVSAEDWSRIRWFTHSGLAGVQSILEHAATGGQIAVDEAVRLLLGLPVDSVPVPDSVPVELSTWERPDLDFF